MHSYWQKEYLLPQADVTIIGAGLTGLFSAYFLSQKFKDAHIRILERGVVPDGASARNAGFACFGSPSELLDDAEAEGWDATLKRVQDRKSGLNQLVEICGQESIDYRPEDGFEVFTSAQAELFTRCREQLSELNQKVSEVLGFEPYEIAQITDFPFSNIEGVIRIRGEASLNSAKVLQQLLDLVRANGVEMHFNQDVQSYKPVDGGFDLFTAGRQWFSRKLVFATNAFSSDFFKSEDFVPGRGQILLSQPLPHFKLSGSYHIERGYFYLRQVNDRLMLGGGRHLHPEVEKTTSLELNAKIQTALEDLLRRLLPDLELKIEQRWAGIMAFGSDNQKEPILKEMPDGSWLAARLGGMGIAMSSHLARSLSQQIDLS